MANACCRCDVLMPGWEAGGVEETRCPFCGAESIVRVFSALFAGRSGGVTAIDAAEGEAACFDHPGKRAAAHCSQCGRFLCQLCSVDFRGSTWCPSCITAGFAKKSTAEMEQSRTLYDSFALVLALGPLLFWPATVFTAPATIFVSVRYWKEPLSIVRRTRWRFVAASLVAAAELGGWVWLVVYLALRLGIPG